MPVSAPTLRPAPAVAAADVVAAPVEAVHDVLSIPLDADAEAASGKLAGMQPLAGLVRGASALGVADRLALTDAPLDRSAAGTLERGFAWRLDDAHAVDVTCSIDVAPSVSGTSSLTVRTRFAGSPGLSADRLLEAYGALGPLWQASMRRLATAVDRAVDRDDELAA